MAAYLLPLATVLHPTKGAGEVCAVDLWRQNPKADVHGIIVAENQGDSGVEYSQVGYLKAQRSDIVEEIIMTIDKKDPRRVLTLQ